jgi:hypothetical protein
MREELVDFSDLMAMANSFSGCRIDPKYFPLMLESSCIIESLNYIYCLYHNRKLSLEDIREMKLIFQKNFRFFDKTHNEKYSKKNLVLSGVFSIFLILSGMGCLYFPMIFVPLAFICGVCLVVCTCLINIPSRSVDLTELYKSCKNELLDLKCNLNQLRNSLVDKCQINTAYDSDNAETPLGEPSGNFEKLKKSVSFAPKLNEFNLFFTDSFETRSRANSYERNGNYLPK